MAAATVNIGTGSGGKGTSTVTISLIETGNNYQGQNFVTPTIASNANSIQEISAVATINGATTITVPTGAGGVIVQPPTAGTKTLTLKGVSGDTGIALSLIAPIMLTFAASPPASFVITSDGIETLTLFWF